jgi:hypothetical protein
MRIPSATPDDPLNYNGSPKDTIASKRTLSTSNPTNETMICVYTVRHYSPHNSPSLPPIEGTAFTTEQIAAEYLNRVASGQNPRITFDRNNALSPHHIPPRSTPTNHVNSMGLPASSGTPTAATVAANHNLAAVTRGDIATKSNHYKIATTCCFLASASTLVIGLAYTGYDLYNNDGKSLSNWPGEVTIAGVSIAFATLWRLSSLKSHQDTRVHPDNSQLECGLPR